MNQTGPIGDHALSDVELTHLKARALADIRRNQWLIRWIGAIWTIASLALLWTPIEEGWRLLTTIMIVSALGGLAFAILGGFGGRPAGKWRVSTIEGPLERRRVSSGKTRDWRSFVGGQPVVYPPHWRGAFDPARRWARVRVTSPRTADGEDLPIAQTYNPWRALAVENGPSIEAERARGVGEWPEFPHGLTIAAVVAGIGVLMGGAATAFLTEGIVSFSGSLGGVRASLTSEQRFENAEALSKITPGPGSITAAAAWTARARFFEGVDRRAGWVLVSDAGRERLLTKRAALDTARAADWAAYQAALETWRATPRQAQAGSIFNTGPAMPSAPTVAPATLEAGELLAVIVRDPRGGGPGSAAGERDPILADLEQPRPVSGIILNTVKGETLEIYPEDLGGEHVITGWMLLLGAASLAALVWISALMWRASQRQKLFEADTAVLMKGDW